MLLLLMQRFHACQVQQCIGLNITTFLESGTISGYSTRDIVACDFLNDIIVFRAKEVYV